MFPDSPRSLGPYLKSVPVPTRIYPPGTVQAYSNYGAMLAGYIVERVSGESYPEYIDRHILSPLGMQHSTMLQPVPERFRDDLAKSYQLASDGHPITPDPIEATADPAGSLACTANDLSRFMLAHLQHGRFGDVQLLKSETADLMHTPAFTPMPGARGTALGFFRMDYNGHRIIVHDGDATASHTDMELLLDDGVGFFSSVNSNGPGGFLNAAYAVRASLFHQFMDRYFPPPPEPDQPTAATANADAQQASGEYKMSRRPYGSFMVAMFLVARISIKANSDGTIETPAFINFEHGRPQEWREIGPFEWREVGGRERLDMKVVDGKVKGWLPRDLATFLLEPVPFVLSGALNLLLLVAAAIVLLLTTLMWPVTAIVRRAYGRPLVLDGRQAQVYRLTHFAAIIGTVFLLSWGVLLLAAGASPAGLSTALDPWIRLIQLIGLVCVAGAAAAVWNAWITFRGRRDWWAKVSSVIVALALLDLVWFSFAFSLISVHLNY
jgi:hypothetical protein